MFRFLCGGKGGNASCTDGARLRYVGGLQQGLPMGLFARRTECPVSTVLCWEFVTLVLGA